MPQQLELDTRRPFLRSEALAAGIPDRVLRSSRFRTIFHGVYLAAGVRVTPELRVAAALRPYTSAAFASHASAARVYGVPIPTIPDEHVSVTRSAGRRARAGIRCHVSDEHRVVEVRGVRVSTPARMFVELGTMLALVDLVVVGDHLVRKGLVHLEQLVEIVNASDLPGATEARRAAAYVRERVDSPMETRLRMLIVLAGLPEPEVNLSLRTADGEVRRRYDLSYPSVRVIVEYDGRQHIEREANWESDLTRREAIDDDEWRILVVIAKGIYRHPEQTLDRILRLLRKRRMPGLPARLDDEWRSHFTGS